MGDERQPPEVLRDVKPNEEPFKIQDDINEGIRRVERRNTELNDSRVYARKCIPVTEVDQKSKGRIKKEVEILKAAQHAHVIKLIDSYFLKDGMDKGRLVIIMEEATQSLAARLEGDVVEREKRCFELWFICLAKAIDYIHSIGIRHRDIKPENILIKWKREQDIVADQIVLADFGISSMGLKRTLSTTLPGVPRSRTEKWAAPEVLDGGTRDSAADIFSLGAVYLAMLHSHSYWTSRGHLSNALGSTNGPDSGVYGRRLQEVHRHISNRLQRLPRTAWTTEVTELCKQMLSNDPKERPDSYRVVTVLTGIQGAPECRCGVGDRVTEADSLVRLCRNGSIEEMTQLLEESGADPCALGAIHQATERESMNFVEALFEKALAKGVQRSIVNQVNAGGQTPLHTAMGFGAVDTVRFLIDHGADVLARDNDGDTLLHCAAAYGKKNMLCLLLQHGGVRKLVNEPNLEAQTPLLYAARRGHTDAAKMLISSGARVNLADNERKTPLHMASGYGCLKTVELLLKNQADVNAIATMTPTTDKNPEKETPLAYALRGLRPQGQFREIIDLLVERGATVLFPHVQMAPTREISKYLDAQMDEQDKRATRLSIKKR